jgi:hypothetical protein
VRDEANEAKRKTAVNKANGKGKDKANGKGKDKANGKGKDKANGKDKGKGKNNGKNNDQLTIETSEEAINSLFRDIDHEEDDGVETQLVAELEATTLNETTTTTRSGRIKRAPVRYRNS